MAAALACRDSRPAGMATCWDSRPAGIGKAGAPAGHPLISALCLLSG